MTRSELLENSLIVAAHADDEILWFSSIAADVDEISVVFCDYWAHPDLGNRRRRAFAAFPRSIGCLDIPESGAIGCANWNDPVETEYGLDLGMEGNRRALTHLARRSLARVGASTSVSTKTVREAYKENFSLIEAALRPKLRSGMNVFTHNPWGEYGHEEHVQVFRVLDKLRKEIGFRLWMTNYCTERTLPLAQRYFSQGSVDYLRLACDVPFAQRAADVYKQAGCWTWTDDWRWFDDECFMEAPSKPAGTLAFQHLSPLNVFTIAGEMERTKWLPIVLGATAASLMLAAATME